MTWATHSRANKALFVFGALIVHQAQLHVASRDSGGQAPQAAEIGIRQTASTETPS